MTVAKSIIIVFYLLTTFSFDLPYNAKLTGQNGGGSNSDRNPFGLSAAPGYMVFFHLF
jgi:hypothetical protein